MKDCGHERSSLIVLLFGMHGTRRKTVRPENLELVSSGQRKLPACVEDENFNHLH